MRAHLADIVASAPHTLPSYVGLARDTLDRVVTHSRALPIRAGAIRRVRDQGRRALRGSSRLPAARTLAANSR